MPSRRLGLIVGATIVAIAAIARLLPLAVPGFVQPDEIYQSLEQTHRLVFGYGLVPWEFSYGARSWLLPTVLAAPMWAGQWFGPGSAPYMATIYGTLALLSATSILCCYAWSRRWFGVGGALLATAIPALWPDALYFGARTLSEAVATPFLVAALYLADPDRRGSTRRQLVIAGALFGIAAALRMQLGPCVIVAWLWCGVQQPRHRLLPLAVGGCGVALFVGLFDTATWGYPFAPEWRNFVFNTVYGISTYYGVTPWHFYIDRIAATWSGLAILLVPMLLAGARRYPLLLVAALAILVPHAIIGHKEYRFIYPAILLLLILAGLGLVQIVAWSAALLGRMGAPSGQAYGTMSIIAWGLAGSLLLVQVGSVDFQALIALRHDNQRAALYASTLPDVCGIELDGLSWWQIGGYSFLHQHVPLYWPATGTGFLTNLAAANVLVTRQRAPAVPGYAVRQCFDSVCVAQRTGRCESQPMYSLPTPPELAGVAPVL